MTIEERETMLKKMAKPLIDIGMWPDEAMQRVRAIDVSLRIEASDYMQIADSHFLKPDFGVKNGIVDKDTRELAAFKVLAAFICETSKGYELAGWAGLIMWCKMSPSEASAYRLRHGYCKPA